MILLEKLLNFLLRSCTRFELIDQDGRQYVSYNKLYQVSFQDKNKTLKVFVSESKKR